MAITLSTKQKLWYFGGALLLIIVLYFVFFGIPGLKKSSRQRKCVTEGGKCYVNIGGQLSQVDCSYCSVYAS